MKIAYVVFARDKAPWIEECIRSILQQKADVEFVFSDQGSTDDTLAIIRKVCDEYNGPNKITILECPVTEPKGRRGLIEHINWLADRLDHDFWITCAADDIDTRNRAERTIKCLGTLDKVPMFLGSAQRFVGPNGENNGVTAHPMESMWISPYTHLEQMVGSSCSGAWSSEYFTKFGKMPDQALVDIHMPFCAALCDSFYFLQEYLHSYVKREDPNNTGLEGRMRLAKTDDERQQIREMILFELAGSAFLCLDTAQKFKEQNGPSEELDMTLTYLHSKVMAQCSGWFEQRHEMTRAQIRPRVNPF